MKKDLHLQGPWKMDEEGMSIHARDCWDHKICDIRGWGYFTGLGGLAMSHEEGEAAQRKIGALIESAPDLLGALKAMLEAFVNPVTKGSLLAKSSAGDMALAAIAKAEGIDPNRTQD